MSTPPSPQDRPETDNRGRLQAVSFDLFGTCLIRRAGAPSDVFRVMGRRLAERLGIERDEAWVEDFVEWRGEAQRRALRQASREEATLAEIWQQLGQLMGPEKLAGTDGPALELAAESETFFPIGRMRQRVARERALGRRILFVSDSHLPADFLRTWLRDQGFAAAGDPVYVSSEAGRTKRSGTLFRHLLEKERLRPADWLHIGDDPIADREAPGRLGIHTELFGASRFSAVERLLLGRRPVADARWSDTAARLRWARLTASGGAVPATPVRNLVSQFLGPFLCTFGHWILDRAGRDGVDRLYFASRDARLLWPVCQRLAAARHPSIDLRYLMISRQAMRLPSISKVTPADLPWLREAHRRPTVPALLARLEVPYDECAPEWLRLRPGWTPEAELTTPLEWALFWRFLGSAAIQPKILAAAGERRRCAQEYLAAQGFFAARSPGYVDLGWFLGSQRGLNRLRADAGNAGGVRGYYLGLKRARLGPAEAGPTTAIFRENAADTATPPHLQWLRRCYLLEQIAGIADHPSVKAYGPGGQIEYVASPASVDRELCQQLESALREYADTFGECWRDLAAEERQLPDFLGVLLADFFDHPSDAAVEVLKGVTFSFDQGAADSERLIAPYSWGDAITAWRPFAKDPARVAPARCWPEASARATPEGIRRVLEAARAFRGHARPASRVGDDALD